MKTSNGFGDMPAMCENEDGKPLPVTLTGVARNHVASFDYFVQHGLSEIVKRLRKVTLQIPGTKDPSSRVHVWFDEISLGKPSREGDEKGYRVVTVGSGSYKFTCKAIS